jgi:hypothetical protein
MAMIMHGCCFICGAYTDVTRLAKGLLTLCGTCQPINPTPCAPFAHRWRGSPRPGHWVCLACLDILTSQAITGSEGDDART